jgi:cysteine desulfurase
MDKNYLDYAATTPVDPQVLETMLPYFNADFGNPSSVHGYGQRAEAALEAARNTIADALNCLPGEIIFTGCGTESDNLALRGAAFASRKTRSASHILISPVEHHAVSHTAAQLASEHGFELEYLPVDMYGQVAPEAVAERLRPDTAVVSIIYGNNEIGTVNPINQIGLVCQAHNVPFHTDAVQAGAHLSLDVQALNVDYMALGAHKFYGPKGVGVLYIRTGAPYLPTLTGGSQESGRRAGTENVPYIVGMATALRLVQARLAENRLRLEALRDVIIERTLAEIPGVRLTGHPDQRLPNHASFVFEGVDGNELLMLLDVAGFACSSGSACKTGSPSPSEVLLATGLNEALALGSLRVTLGQWTTETELEHFLASLPECVARARLLEAG